MISQEQFEEWIDHWREFNCAACGRYVIGLGMPKMEPPICGACLSHPGWPKSEFMRKILDPGNTRWQAAVKLSAIEVECRASWLDASMAWLHGAGKHWEVREQFCHFDPSEIEIDRDYDRPVGQPEQRWLH